MQTFDQWYDSHTFKAGDFLEIDGQAIASNKYPRGVDHAHIWTVIDNEEQDTWDIAGGVHHINALGWIVTQEKHDNQVIQTDF